MLGDESMDSAHTLQAVRHSSFTEHPALLVQQADVVMLFRPVNSQEDHGHLLTCFTRAGGGSPRPNGQCSTARHPTSGRPPPQAAAARSLPRVQTTPGVTGLDRIRLGFIDVLVLRFPPLRVLSI